METTSRLNVLWFCLLVAWVSFAVRGNCGTPSHPFPKHIEYAEGALIPNHASWAELDDDVRAAYWRWKGRYLAEAGTETDGHPRYRILTGSAPSSATVSEGQGYGMMIVALMAGEDPEAQTLFDGLLEFFKDHPSESDSRLMDWHVPADESGEPGWDSSAFDGDCDIALALLLADSQWGSQGRMDYGLEFELLIAAISGSTIGPDSHLPMLGDWVETDGESFNQYTTRSSDFMPDHFRAFAAATGDPTWIQVIQQTQNTIDTIQATYSSNTGLLPDFIVPFSSVDPTPQPAPPGFLEGPYDGDYYYNAGRDPWRIGSDAVLFGDDRSKAQALRLSQWIRQATGENPSSIKGGFRLDGTPIGNYFTSFFAGPFGVAAMIDPEGQQWLNQVYVAVKDRQEGYYEDSVTLLCLLVMSHNAWVPGNVRVRDQMIAQPQYLE